MEQSVQNKTMDELRCFCRNNKNNGLKGHSKFTKKEDLKEFIIDNYEGGIETIDENQVSPKFVIIDDTNFCEKYEIIEMNNKLYMDMQINNTTNKFEIRFTSDDNEEGHLVNETIPYTFIFDCMKLDEDYILKIKGIHNDINRFIYDKNYSINTNLLISLLDIQSNTKSFKVELEPFYNEYHNDIYNLYKENIIKKSNIFNEKLLFHGTSEKNKISIINTGFSLTCRREHGRAHGEGIYFTNNIEFALKYSNDSKNHMRNGRYNMIPNTNINTNTNTNINTNTNMANVNLPNASSTSIINEPVNRVEKTNVRYVIAAMVGVNHIILGKNAREVFPIGPDGIQYDTGVDSMADTKQWVKKDKEQIKIVGVFKITMKDDSKVIDKIKMKFINRTNREIYIYYDPLKHTSNQKCSIYVNAQLLLHHCKLMGKVSSKPDNIISGCILNVTGYINDEFICGWHNNDNFHISRTFKSGFGHIAVDKSEHFYIE